MYKTDDILFHIRYYEKELRDSYSLFKTLEAGVVTGNSEQAQLSIDDTIKHIKYICFLLHVFLI